MSGFFVGGSVFKIIDPQRNIRPGSGDDKSVVAVREMRLCKKLLPVLHM